MVFETLLTGLLLFFGGGLTLSAGAHSYHLARLITLDHTPTGSIDEDGPVAVEGTIQSALEDPLISPIQQQSGYPAKWTVEEYTGHSLAVGGGWTDFGTGYEAIPFVIDDGTGPVTIDVQGEEQPRQLELELPEHTDEPVYEQAVTETPPATIRGFLTEHDTELRDQQAETEVPTREASDEQGDHRYYEQVLQAGDTVYVVGHAMVTDVADPTAAKVTIGPNANSRTPFYLSDTSRTSAWRRRVARITVLGTVGPGLTWYSLSYFFPAIPFPL